MLSPRLQTILGAQFSEIEESHLAGLITHGVSEADDLDYKEAQYDYGKKGTFEISKDVAAFANEIGGLIVIGIREEQGVACELRPVKISTEVESRMMQALAIKVFPMIRDVSIRRVRSTVGTDQFYLLVDIPRSATAPHGVLLDPIDQHPLCWPSRAGATTRFLREGELASRYRDRFELARGQVGRLSHIQEEGASHPEAISIRALTMDLALVPEVSMHFPARRTVAELRDYANESGPHYEKLGFERARAKFLPKRRRLRVAAETNRWELYADGAVWMRVFVGVPSAGSMPMVRINVRDMEAKLVSMLRFAAGFSLWAGAGGDCALAVRIGGDTTGRLLLLDGDGGEILGEPVGAVISPVELTWSLGDLDTAAGATRAAYLMASDLEQDLGLAAPLLDGEQDF